MVYFLKRIDGDLVKIGYSGLSVVNRMHNIAISIPFPVEIIGVMKGDRKTEKDLHKRFSKWRIGGEWFLMSDEVSDFVSRSTEPYSSELHDADGMTIGSFLDVYPRTVVRRAFAASGYSDSCWRVAVRGDWLMTGDRLGLMLDYLEEDTRKVAEFISTLRNDSNV